MMVMIRIALMLLSALSVHRLPSASGYTSDGGGIRNISAVKTFFRNPIVKELREFPYFRRKFDVPYLDVSTALIYAREIARASALHPLFLNKSRVEELVLDRLLRTLLSSSEDSCTTAESTASRIGDILTDIGIDRGLLTNRTSESVMRLYAGYISGTVLLRLSKLPDPTPWRILGRLNGDSSSKLIRLLSGGLKNSSYVSGFCSSDGGELDLRKSKVLSSAISSSNYLGYDLGMVRNLSKSMEEGYRSSKAILGGRLKHESRILLVPALVAECVISRMIHKGFAVEGKVDEVFRDVLKLIKLGITMDKMNLKDYDVKHYLI